MRYSDKIGRRIRSVREARGYSQEYMAEVLGTCQSSYANLESGKSNMSVERLLQITEILEMDIHHWFDQDYKSISLASHDPSGDGKKLTTVHPEIKLVYEQLIGELRTEIDFLRNLVHHLHHQK